MRSIFVEECGVQKHGQRLFLPLSFYPPPPPPPSRSPPVPRPPTRLYSPPRLVAKLPTPRALFLSCFWVALPSVFLDLMLGLIVSGASKTARVQVSLGNEAFLVWSYLVASSSLPLGMGPMVAGAGAFISERFSDAASLAASSYAFFFSSSPAVPEGAGSAPPELLSADGDAAAAAAAAAAADGELLDGGVQGHFEPNRCVCVYVCVCVPVFLGVCCVTRFGCSAA